MSELAVVYRYSAGGNRKLRPAWFSKELALASFLESVRACRAEVDVVFLVDGGASREVLDRMHAAGRVFVGTFGSARRSYLAQLHTVRSGVVDADLVWFAEDDYLYDVEALDVLARAARTLSGADYFALSGPTIVSRLECRHAQTEVDVPAPREPLSTVAGRDWRRIASTTSTFGVRREAFAQDYRLLRLAPWSGAAWDRSTCLAVQGVRPYPWRSIHRDLVVASSPERHRAVRSVWKLGLRVAVNVASYRPRRRRRILAAPSTALVAHVELPFEEHPAHWDAVGRATAEQHDAAVGEYADLG